ATGVSALSLHDALPILGTGGGGSDSGSVVRRPARPDLRTTAAGNAGASAALAADLSGDPGAGRVSRAAHGGGLARLHSPAADGGAGVGVQPVVPGAGGDRAARAGPGSDRRLRDLSGRGLSRDRPAPNADRRLPGPWRRQPDLRLRLSRLWRARRRQRRNVARPVV